MLSNDERPKYVGIEGQNSWFGYLKEISEFLNALEDDNKYTQREKIKHNPLSYEGITINLTCKEVKDISDTCKFIAKQLQ